MSFINAHIINMHHTFKIYNGTFLILLSTFAKKKGTPYTTYNSQIFFYYKDKPKQFSLILTFPLFSCETAFDGGSLHQKTLFSNRLTLQCLIDYWEKIAEFCFINYILTTTYWHMISTIDFNGKTSAKCQTLSTLLDTGDVAQPFVLRIDVFSQAFLAL